MNGRKFCELPTVWRQPRLFYPIQTRRACGLPVLIRPVTGAVARQGWSRDGLSGNIWTLSLGVKSDEANFPSAPRLSNFGTDAGYSTPSATPASAAYHSHSRLFGRSMERPDD